MNISVSTKSSQRIHSNDLNYIFKLRKFVFHDRLRWQVNCFDGMDRCNLQLMTAYRPVRTLVPAAANGCFKDLGSRSRTTDMRARGRQAAFGVHICQC